jgi:hypothetical protein
MMVEPQLNLDQAAKVISLTQKLVAVAGSDKIEALEKVRWLMSILPSPVFSGSFRSLSKTAKCLANPIRAMSARRMLTEWHSECENATLSTVGAARSLVSLSHVCLCCMKMVMAQGGLLVVRVALVHACTPCGCSNISLAVCR